MTGVKSSNRSERGIRKSQGSNAVEGIAAAHQCYGNPAISRNPLYKDQILAEVAERRKAVCLSFWAAQSNARFYIVPKSSERREEKAKRGKETCTTERWGTTFHLNRARSVHCPCGYNRVETWAFWSTAIGSSTKISNQHIVLLLTDKQVTSLNVRCYHRVIECCSFIPAFSFLLISLLLCLDHLQVILGFLTFLVRFLFVV